MSKTAAQRRRSQKKHARSRLAKRFPHSRECNGLVVEGRGPWPECICGAFDRRNAARKGVAP